jgi:hypothetical protein
MNRLIKILICVLLLALVNISFAKQVQGQSILKTCLYRMQQAATKDKTLMEIKTELAQYDCKFADMAQLKNIPADAKLQSVANCAREQYAAMYLCTLNFDNNQRLKINEALYPTLKPCINYYQQFVKEKIQFADIKATLDWISCRYKANLANTAPTAKAQSLKNCKVQTRDNQLTCQIYFDDGSNVTFTGVAYPDMQ